MHKLLIPLAISTTILFSACSKKQEAVPVEPKVIKKINITIKNGTGECSLPGNNDYMTIPHE